MAALLVTACYILTWATDHAWNQKLRQHQVEPFAAELYGRGLSFSVIRRHLRGPNAFEVIAAVAPFEPQLSALLKDSEGPDILQFRTRRNALPKPLPQGWTTVNLDGEYVVVIATYEPFVQTENVEFCRDSSDTPDCMRVSFDDDSVDNRRSGWRARAYPVLRTLERRFSAQQLAGLRAAQRERLSARLGAHCAACAGRTSVDAESAQTLSWIQEQACKLPIDRRLHDAIFLGGANDDLLWASNGGPIKRALSLVPVLIEPLEFGPWTTRVRLAAHASRIHLDHQSDAIRATAECLRVRGAHFFFAHDFLAWDLESGRSDDRAVMANGRRVAVEAAGGTFIDLYEEFKASAGVSWFSDFIHPSAVGHQRIAELICRRLDKVK